MMLIKKKTCDDGCWKPITNKFFKKHFCKNMNGSCQSNSQKQRENKIKLQIKYVDQNARPEEVYDTFT